MSKELTVAIVGGIFTLIVAIITIAVNVDHASDRQPLPPSTVSIVIYDRLHQSQISETVDIIIDGRSRGSIVVDQSRPEASMTITMPPGRYSYTVNAVALFSNQQTFFGTGQGIIEVGEGKEYDLQASISGSTWLVTLVERP